MRDLIASIDAIQTSELSWFTQQMGRWWSAVRWQATPVDPMGAVYTNRQKLALRLRGYDAFWRSYDNVTMFPPPDDTDATTGFVQVINVGDQPMWPRFTCFGPGTFTFGNGPSSTDLVSFGPLLANQVAQIRTDPRKRSVVDLSSTPATPQTTDQFGTALADLISFLSLGLITPFEDVLQSVFGIFGGSPVTPPQGNLYSLLNGRFSNPIPARSPGNPIQPYYTAVGISGGNSSSGIITAGTPLRRNPF